MIRNLIFFFLLIGLVLQNPLMAQNKDSLDEITLEAIKMKQKIDSYLLRNGAKSQISEKVNTPCDSLKYLSQNQKLVIDSLQNQLAFFERLSKDKNYKAENKKKKTSKIKNDLSASVVNSNLPKDLSSKPFVIADSISIFFEQGVFKLDYVGVVTLDSAIFKLSTKNISIIGFSESSGIEARNKNLKILRAIDVREYLLSKGIKAEQIVAEGVKECTNEASNFSKFQSCRLVKIYTD